jgi:exodeoxyribonuclease-3
VADGILSALEDTSGRPGYAAGSPTSRSLKKAITPLQIHIVVKLMKIATWNVNSLKVRLPHVLDWLEQHPVDALCLQELKQPSELFPREALAEIGYQACWTGQKTYNGVAIISRDSGQDVQCNLPDFDDHQQRIIAATLPSPIGDIRIVSAYCPNGQSVGSDKYEYKLKWFEALHSWLRSELERYPRLAILGDYNVAPKDEDVYDPSKWVGEVLVSEAERAAFNALLGLGLSDAFRQFEQEPGLFSWWDYRRFAFRRNAGMRIDHVLLSDALRPLCTACVIDKEPRKKEQPSDHAPVIATLDLQP